MQERGLRAGGVAGDHRRLSMQHEAGSPAPDLSKRQQAYCGCVAAEMLHSEGAFQFFYSIQIMEFVFQIKMQMDDFM